APGLHEVRLRIESGATGWTSPPYRIAVPVAGGNTHFEMHRLSEGASVLEAPDAIKSLGIEAQWHAHYQLRPVPPPILVAYTSKPGDAETRPSHPQEMAERKMREIKSARVASPAPSPTVRRQRIVDHVGV